MASPAFIPPDAEWFLADLVIAIHVGKRKRVTVHVNTVLVHARSAREAFKKAVELGRRAVSTYPNAAGERVRFQFLGLRNLDVVHDALEHGCELRFTESIGKTLKGARSLVVSRGKLGAFRPRKPSRVPDYVRGDLRRALDTAMRS